MEYPIQPPTLYWDPTLILPLKSAAIPVDLSNIALQVREAAARLTGSVHPVTSEAIWPLLHPVNSYYAASLADQGEQPQLASMQAYLAAYEQLLSLLFLTGDNPYNASFYQSVHRVLYQHLPQELLGAASLKEQAPAGAPGQWRSTDTPDAPAAKALPSFLRVLASSYRLEAEPDLLVRVVNVAVAHYCLGWMQPFGAGNEGVAPLYSEAAVVMTGLSAEGMWSLVRGLARQAPEYQRLLKEASIVNTTAPDGKGTLSQPHLLAFCRFFLQSMLGELRFMTHLLDRDEVLTRLKGLVKQLGRRQGWRAEAYYVLEAVWLKGQIKRGDVMRLTGLSDKTAKALAQALLAAGFLATDEDSRAAPYRAAYPAAAAPVLFPGLYPAPREQELLVALSVAD